jgi:hypothetical protein
MPTKVIGCGATQRAEFFEVRRQSETPTPLSHWIHERRMATLLTLEVKNLSELIRYRRGRTGL